MQSPKRSHSRSSLLERGRTSQAPRRGRTSKTADANLKAIVIYTSDGHFAFVSVRADLPKLANANRALATAEEAKAVVAGSIAYFGTYLVNEADKVLTGNVEASTYANLLETDQNALSPRSPRTS